MHRMRFDDLFTVLHDMCSGEVSEDDLNSTIFACGWTPQEYERRLKECKAAEEYVRIFRERRATMSN